MPAKWLDQLTLLQTSNELEARAHGKILLRTLVLFSKQSQINCWKRRQKCWKAEFSVFYAMFSRHLTRHLMTKF